MSENAGLACSAGQRAVTRLTTVPGGASTYAFDLFDSSVVESLRRGSQENHLEAFRRCANRRTDPTSTPMVVPVVDDVGGIAAARTNRRDDRQRSCGRPPIGRVESSLKDADSAPKQGDEGAPDAWLVFDAEVAAGLRDLRAGTEILVLTWWDRGRRDVLTVHPRGDSTRDDRGVFSTRSPNRPNPIGLHPVEIIAIDGTRVLVRDMEGRRRDPILDVNP